MLLNETYAVKGTHSVCFALKLLKELLLLFTYLVTLCKIFKINFSDYYKF